MLALAVSPTSKEPYISTKEPYISTQESYITFMSPTKVMLALAVQSRTLLGVPLCRRHECDAGLLCGNIGLFCGNVGRFCKTPSHHMYCQHGVRRCHFNAMQR